MGLFDKDSLTRANAREQSPKEHTILVVDDEASNRFTLESLFKSRYNVVQARDGQEALDFCKKPDSPEISVVICDQRMPRMSGTSFLEKLIPIMPLTRRIVLTGFMDISTIIESVNNAQIYQFVVKPYDRDELLLIVNRAVEAYTMEKKLTSYHEELEQRVEERTKALEAQNQAILKTRDQLLLQRKMASIGTLTTGVAQEIRNPLNFVNNFALTSAEMTEELKRLIEMNKAVLPEDHFQAMDDYLEDLHANCRRISQYGAKAEQIVESMLDFAAGNQGEWQNTEINGLVEKFATIAFQAVKAREMDFEAELRLDLDDSTGKMEVVTLGLSRAVANLVINAMESLIARAQREPNFQPVLRIRSRRWAGNVEIIVEDNGEGIPEENLDKIFQPFFTTRLSSENIGLGLVMTRDIITQEHGGQLNVVSGKDERTQFIIKLPV